MASKIIENIKTRLQMAEIAEDIKTRLPNGYDIRYVTHSRYYLGNGWVKSSYSDNLRNKYAIEVIDQEGKVKAAFGWAVLSRNRGIVSSGVYVEESLRRRGIAKLLFEAAIGISKPGKIYVATVSDEGFTLINSVKNKFPGIEFINTSKHSYVFDLKTGERYIPAPD